MDVQGFLGPQMLQSYNIVKPNLVKGANNNFVDV